MGEGSIFKLRRPCDNCPFRADVPPYLRKGRAVEIATALAGGAVFPCHKTTVEDPDDDSNLVVAPDSQFCAGALLVLEHSDAPNQIMRIAERIGEYDASRMDREAPVLRSLAAFVDHHGGEAEPDDEEGLGDCCEIVEADCEAPAGHMVGGSMIPADNEGAELHLCPTCGTTVCGSCSNDAGVCVYCADVE